MLHKAPAHKRRARPRKKRRNRSVSKFSGDEREMAEAAADNMQLVTLIQYPLPDPERSQDIVEAIWKKIQNEFGCDCELSEDMDRYVCSG